VTGQPGGKPLAVLIGPPGAGKTAIGPLLAELLETSFRDTDAEISAATGQLVSDIFIEQGEPAFRQLEREAAARALREQREHGGVLALGSGAVLDPGTQDRLEGLPVVYLAADFTTVARRLGLDRPRVVVPGNPRGRLRAMLEERRPLYERLATVTVKTDDADPDELAEQIAAQLNARLDARPREQQPREQQPREQRPGEQGR
jgi:shikimate kinase